MRWTIPGSAFGPSAGFSTKRDFRLSVSPQVWTPQPRQHLHAYSVSLNGGGLRLYLEGGSRDFFVRCEFTTFELSHAPQTGSWCAIRPVRLRRPVAVARAWLVVCWHCRPQSARARLTSLTADAGSATARR